LEGRLLNWGLKSVVVAAAPQGTAATTTITTTLLRPFPMRFCDLLLRTYYYNQPLT
jgi:hypothetical protein